LKKAKKSKEEKGKKGGKGKRPKTKTVVKSSTSKNKCSENPLERMFGNFGGFDDDDDFFSDPFSRRSRGGSNNRQIQQRRGRPQDPFAAMEQRMSQMMGGFGGMGGFGDLGGGGSFQMMSSSSSFGGGGPGFSSSSTMVMSSKMGPDGKMHTERYSSSATHDRSNNAFEQQQAYNNSSTGQDKMSLERQHGGRGRKMVKEYSHGTGEERQTEFLKGMEDHEKDEFDQRWQRDIAPNMPRHSHGMRGGGGSNHLGIGNGGQRQSSGVNGRRQQRALGM